MTNDDLRAILQEELTRFQVSVQGNVQGTLDVFRTEMRESLDGFRTEVRESLGTFRTEMREEVRESLGTFRTEMRGEIHAAVQASEARMNLRFDQMQKNLLEVKGNVALLDSKVDKLDHKVDQFALVLDETTIKIASMQNDIYNLENKLDTHIEMTAQLKRDVQRIDATVQKLVQQIFELNRRLLLHIATPWDQAHPGPNPAA